MGQTVNYSTQSLTGLANQIHDGALADSVYRFFQGVAADLSPLDDILREVIRVSSNDGSYPVCSCCLYFVILSLRCFNAIVVP